jgi:ribonuclease HI
MPWIPVMLRGTRVFARCDDAGSLVADAGRVEIRYKANDGKSYRAMLANLLPVQGEKALPDAHCGAAEPVAKKTESTPGGAKAAGGATPAARGKSAKSNAVPPVPDGAITVYADGACSGNPGPSGLGVVIVDAGAQAELSEYLGAGTNNIGELTAILRALERLAGTEREVWLHTDSQYAIGVLSKGWKAKANQELIATLRETLRAFRKVHLVYVPGHAGVPLNERADELARAAVEARRSSGWKERRL